VDQPTRAGEIAVDQEAAGPERRELDGPALRASGEVHRERGGGGALGGATGVELGLSAHPLPEVTAPGAGGPERIAAATVDLDPVLDRLGEHGKDEQ
jgi:hypothetical protein